MLHAVFHPACDVVQFVSPSPPSHQLRAESPHQEHLFHAKIPTEFTCRNLPPFFTSACCGALWESSLFISQHAETLPPPERALFLTSSHFSRVLLPVVLVYLQCPCKADACFD
ncbi:hypothetical protein CHARACLAT_026790 [Characodon lateralis]|uniref:Uncharacterized protein n=1 Tax=Characodon lateralis TaxID=208331 RepID=A0ABU7CRI7_9TELE|nr:hypothetical protein [Characodon lateralis]